MVVGPLEGGTVFKRHVHKAESTVFNLGGELRLEFDDQTVISRMTTLNGMCCAGGDSTWRIF